MAAEPTTIDLTRDLESTAGQGPTRADVDGLLRDALDTLDEPVERCVLGVDARLEEREAVLSLLVKASGQVVVAGEIQVDDAKLAWIGSVLLGGR